MTFASPVDAARGRISAELHDRLGPNLAAVALNLKIIENKLGSLADPETHQLLGESRSLLEESVAEIRDLTAELRPARLEYAGLDPALHEFAQQYRRRTGLETRLTVALAPPGQEAPRFDPALEWLVFRVVQEAVGNCARHAAAGSVAVELRREGDLLRLQIDDDGVGFDPDKLGRGIHPPGIGLLEIRERVASAGGRFSLSSRPGHGTHLLVTVPIAAPAAAAAATPARLPAHG